MRLFDPEFPPIPWVTYIACKSRGGNNWRLLKDGERWDGRTETYDDLEHSVTKCYAYDPGWQDRLPVEWYAKAYWREHAVSTWANTYIGAEIRALWRVFWYRLVIRRLDREKPTPRWCMRLGMW